MSARKFALGVARRGWAGAVISFCIRHFYRALSLKRIGEDADLAAFFHPAPSCDPHILIVPKQRARTVFDLPEPIFRAALHMGAEIARRYEVPLQLRINGGARQEVMQAHFHLYPASGHTGMTRADTFPDALSLARGASGFSLVMPVGENGIWVGRDERGDAGALPQTPLKG